jgi:hypothetical protein
MKKDIIIYPILFSSIFFMMAISLLSLQDSDIKIPQKESTISINIINKFNLDIASSDNQKLSN